MRYLPLIMCLFLVGCATGPGSRAWYKERINEIETAYQNKEITKAEYLSLKNGADNVVTSLLGGGTKVIQSPQPVKITGTIN